MLGYHQYVFLLYFRKDDWPEKRIALDRSDFGRQERYQDFDHRDRGRYQDDMMLDRRDSTRGIGADRDGQVREAVIGLVCNGHKHQYNMNLWHLEFCLVFLQHFSDRSERHGREGREPWTGGYDKRMNPRWADLLQLKPYLRGRCRNVSWKSGEKKM